MYTSIVPKHKRTASDDLNEASPLLHATDSDDEPPSLKISDGDDDDIWQGEERETRSSFYLFLLTFGSLG
jgi:hypothetical protein